MATPAWLDFVLIAAQLLAAGLLLALLGLLSQATWTLAHAQVSSRRQAARDLWARWMRAVWATLAVMLPTAGLLEMHRPAVTLPDVAHHGAETLLPHAWAFASTEGTDQAYALLTLASYLFLAQVLIGAMVLTRRPAPPPSTGSPAPSEAHGAAWVATFTLIAAVFAVIPLATASYLHLVAHLHPQAV